MTEIVTHDIQWARRITERFRIQATNYSEARAKVWETAREAQAGSAWSLLGYRSWTDYLSDVLGDSPLLLERDSRRELVPELSAMGMTTRAIASVVGAGIATVSRDLEATRVPSGTPVESTPSAPTPEDGTDMSAPVSTPPAPKLMGRDGKEYTRPGAQSLTEKVREAMSDNEWHTLPELAEKVGTNDATVSARIRDLRKVQFGNHEVQRRRTPSGSYEYRLDGDKGARPAPRSRQVATPTPAPRIGGNRKRHAAVIESMNVSLSGLAMAADQITELDNTVTAEKAAQLLDDLSTSIRSLNRLKQQLNTRKVTP